jgi:predicted GIY-YIG superfamily endonuclease
VSWPPGPSVVYRLYDSTDALLYIGVTEDPEARFAAHAATKHWWPEVVQEKTKISRRYDSREEAEAAEDEAIRTEHARHNVARSPWAPKPRQLGENEMSLTDAKASLSELVDRVRLLRQSIVIVRPTRDRRPNAALVPVELAEAAETAGGMDAAAEILRKAAQ